ncbi:hypothetical protein JJE66_19950 [Bradyrhizobium diazoefficiens]|uniref:hypothetical protein n=1 Tax=Bradyrhizobium diazoefficiens TaxID=1355477 RepID=UPI00190C3EA7|nr:hypothetical protein [Bradyrhizobium diazoefficiens]MBK3663484.1 hypothetical protein [Bradyrhizobium diazoefficiens]
MNPEKRVTQAVEQAQSILARYVEPGPRDCESTINELMDVLDDEAVVEAVEDAKMEKPTSEQLAELKRLSELARTSDWSEVVKSREEAETRIRDLKEKSRME